MDVYHSSVTTDRIAIRLLQGYLWHPKDLELSLNDYLPHKLDKPEDQTQDGAVYVLWDEVNPPTTFFENGNFTSDQQFYQFTVFKIYPQRPTTDALGLDAQQASTELDPHLNSTPKSVGWQIWEDLREL